MQTTTSTGYGLRHKTTMKLARLLQEETDGNGYSNAEQYRLVDEDDDTFAVFEVDTPEKAALVLVVDTKWYNSTEVRPSWGSLDMADFEVVEIVRVSSVDIQPFSVPTPVQFGRAVEVRKTMRKLAERYLGHSIPEKFNEATLSFVVVPLPDGETVESLKVRCTNQPALLNTSMGFPEMCLGVFELPDEYKALFSQGLGVGLILTQFKA